METNYKPKKLQRTGALFSVFFLMLMMISFISSANVTLATVFNENIRNASGYSLQAGLPGPVAGTTGSDWYNDAPGIQVNVTLNIIGTGDVYVYRYNGSLAYQIQGPVDNTTLGPFPINEVLKFESHETNAPAFTWKNWTGALNGTQQIQLLTVQDGQTVTAIFGKTINPATEVGFTFGTNSPDYNNKTKVYDATTAVPNPSISYTGYPAHPAVTVKSGTPTYNNKNVGTGKTVTFPGLYLDGADAIYYTLLSNTGTTTGAITTYTPNLTVIHAVANDKVFNRFPDATIGNDGTPIQLVGYLPADEGLVTLVNPGTGSFDNYHVGVDKPVVPNFSLGGPAAGNYALTKPALMADITPKPLTLGPIVIANKVFYDVAPFTAVVTSWGSLGGVINPDQVGFNKDAAVTVFNEMTVGTGRTVSVTGVVLTGANESDYMLVQPLSPAPTGTIIAPMYAMFNPTYNVGDRSNPDKNPIPGVRVNAPLTIEFNYSMYDVNGELVNNNSVGDLVRLEKAVSSDAPVISWELVPFTANRVLNKITLVPDAILEHGKFYRLSFRAIYAPPSGTPVIPSSPVIYTLDKGPNGFDNTIVGALVQGKEVYFRTMKDLPIVTPYGEDKQVCSALEPIVLEFMHPVKYRNGLPIQDSPSHKFKIQSSPTGDDPWTDVPASQWSLAINTPNTPTIFTFTLSQDLKYCTYYRFQMQKGYDVDYGFEDITDGEIFLNHEIAFKTQQGNDGWNWKTKCCYKFFADVSPWKQDPEFGARPDNLNNVQVGQEKLITYVWNAGAGRYDTVYKRTAFTRCLCTNPTSSSDAPSYQWQSELGSTAFSDANGSTCWTSLLAQNGVGYHFTDWRKNGVLQYVPNSNPPQLIGPEYPFDFVEQSPACGHEDVHYKASFAVNTYNITANPYDENGSVQKNDWGMVTVNLPNPVLHGKHIVITATPKPGYYFVGWDVLNTMPSEGNMQQHNPMYSYSTAPPERCIQDPTLDPATLEFDLKGNELVHNQSFGFKAKFAVYYPLLRAASGLEGTGEQPSDVPIGLIEITTSFNPLFVGPEEGTFQYLQYEYDKFAYAHPPTPMTTAKLRAWNAPCKYTFVKWQRWIPNCQSSSITDGTWVTFPGTGTETNTFPMNQDYRLKAVYKLKDDVHISATANTAALGTVVLQKTMSSAPSREYQDCDGTPVGDIYINDANGANFTWGDKLRITCYSEPDYYAWHFTDGNGNIIPTGSDIGQISLVSRFEDRSVWCYTVSCANVDLKAVFDFKEFPAIVRSLNKNEGTISTSAPAFNPNVGHQGGLGFNFSYYGTNNISQKGEGIFQRTKPITFAATATAYPWAFDYWQVVSGNIPGDADIHANPLIIAPLQEQMDAVELIAIFKDITPPAPTYLLTTAVEPAETGTVSENGVSYEADAPVSLTATAMPGYTFTNWTYTGDDIAVSPDLTSETINFNMPARAVTFTAHFALTSYTVTAHVRTYIRAVDYQPENYTINTVGGQVTQSRTSGTFGQSVMVTATPNPGFRFVNWMTGKIKSDDLRLLRGHQISGGSTSCTYIIPAVMGNPPVDLYAIFVEIADPQYIRNTLTTSVTMYPNNNPEGEIRSDADWIYKPDGLYPYGVEILVKQKPNPGFEFIEWSGMTVYPDAEGDYVSMDVAANSPQNLKANYQPILYQLCVHSNNTDYGTVSPNYCVPYTVLSNPIQVSAYTSQSTCPENFEFKGWYTNEGCTDELLDAYGNHVTDAMFYFTPKILPLPETDFHIYAKFVSITREYTVTSATALDFFMNLNDAVGTTTITGLGNAALPWNCNDDVLISTTPNPGYAFQHWTNCEGTWITDSPSFIQTVYGDYCFRALYTAIVYNVHATHQTGGTVDPVDQGKTIGQTVTVTAAPLCGYAFVNWTATGVTLTPEQANSLVLVFTMPPNDVTLQANFAPIPYSFAASVAPGAGGSLSTTNATYTVGQTVNITATANCGYNFTGWTATGITLSSEQAGNRVLSFAMPCDAVTLVANFTAIPYALTLTSDPSNGGTFVPATGTTYTVGQPVSVTATTNPGFLFVNWTAAGITLGSTTNPVVSFTMPCNAVTLVAHYVASGNSIGGQVKYFNQYETVIPQSANIWVSLEVNGNEVKAPRPLIYNTAGVPQGSYLFEGITPGTNYTIKLWEVGTGGSTLANTWSWNNWGGVNSLDALIISYMYLNTASLPTQFPWLTNGAAVPNWTAYFAKIANVSNDAFINNNDALFAMYRSIGYPGTSPFPGGAFNFQVAGQTLMPGATMVYPAAPATVFAQTGTYAAGSVATSVYYKGAVTGTAGEQKFNVYYVATGDVDASYVPANTKSTSETLAYNDVLKVNVGDEVRIPVTVDQDLTLGAMTLGFAYDKSLLKVTGVEGFEVFNIDEANGTVRASMFNVDGSSYSKNSNVIIVKATVLAPIAATTRYFELENNTIFADRSATPIDGITLSTPYLTTDNATSTGNLSADMKHKAFPNPFNNVSNIQYTLPATASVEVNVYNSLGGLVKSLVNETQVAGVHSIQLKNTDLNGAGVYFYRITVKRDSKTSTGTGSLILIK